MLWEVDIYPAEGCADRAAEAVVAAAKCLGLRGGLAVATCYGYLLEGELDEQQAREAASDLLADSIVERTVVRPANDPRLTAGPNGAGGSLLHVLPRPGVMDPVAQSAASALADLGLPIRAVRTFRKYWIAGADQSALQLLASKALSNDAVDQAVWGPLAITRLDVGTACEFRRVDVPLRSLADDELVTLSRSGQLYLTLAEMRAIQAHFRQLGRDPSDVELETIAQTWSEHCSHKTLKGSIRYRDEQGERQFNNLLKETVFTATQAVRRQLGPDDWCVSVFEDNAGIVRFDDRFDLVFKVETHNHPSALEPYGGANTGLGGVIRDALGTGLGAKPVCNTDIFCFAEPNIDARLLPPGVLHPGRIIAGVVAGVRDYGNRMGIPTVNGAVYFDRRYLANPLVFCGTVGLLPVDRRQKHVEAGDLIVALGGRTGRDGIHGATFSSAELTHESEGLSGGAVQIGNAIEEKKVLDVVLAARDRGLFRAITDCGAGGFSSAVGEMGAELGAEVELERIPLKYEGLSYAEMWISEAQERMVLAVPADCWPEFQTLAASEGVAATALGKFVPTGRLTLRYRGVLVGDLTMEFLHDGRPPIVREATYQPPAAPPLELRPKHTLDFNDELLAILASPNVASKEWIIRQYDHEVQGGSVVKPLVGAHNDGPSDAAVVRPVLGSQRALVVACGMNPCYGDFDTYHMATSAIDEAVRNCVAVGADPRRIAILDNFCWGNTDRAETLGSLVRAALACRDLAPVLGTPFISGKDSLNNEFNYVDAEGQSKTISIPPSLLISALGQIDDASRAVTMDLKRPGDLLYQVGPTCAELGGSHLARSGAATGGQVPTVNAERAKAIFAALHAAIAGGLVRACHDLSEGGLAAAAAEMALAGNLGARLFLAQAPHELAIDDAAVAEHRDAVSATGDANLPAVAFVADATAYLLFAESNSRFLCEVEPDQSAAFEAASAAVPHALVGEVTDSGCLEIIGLPIVVPGIEPGDSATVRAPKVIDVNVADLKRAWQSPAGKG
ncbi:MAG: phosphoribosylformylglycinamidine synthase subunit PurL [Pirellulales bacterium]|nr:phosphoribosylformylglycinamidine synthase subunit PurL [Pirellulales bacterium]